MKEMKLVVGDLSTWSLRAWLCLKMADLPFETIVVHLGAPGYKEKLAQYSETMLVPVLDTGEFKIHDSLGIAEYANELSEGRLLPVDRSRRALCRSLCSELHAGFPNTRKAWPFTWNSKASAEVAAPLQAEVDRLRQIWSLAKNDYYFGTPTMVDAFYGVMAFRLKSHGLEFTGEAGRYQQALLAWPLFLAAMESARAWSAAGGEPQ